VIAGNKQRDTSFFETKASTTFNASAATVQDVAILKPCRADAAVSTLIPLFNL
jgi:hypothetical protein